MKKRGETYRILVHLVLCLFIAEFFIGCIKEERSQESSETFEKNEVIKDIAKRLEYRVDSLLTTMTLEDRVGQCLMPSILSSGEPINLHRLKKWIEDCHIGGIVLLKGDIPSVEKLISVGEISKIPMFIAIDAERGLGMRLRDAEVYPFNGDINKETDENKLFDYGQRIALESRDIGINMILGPVIDIDNKGKGIIGKRSFGNNPRKVSDYGVAYAKGLEAGGVISVAKHFPGHGRALRDSHKRIATLTGDISMLDSVDLQPFKEYVNSGLSGIMAGHIQSLALDPDGKAASVSMDMLSSLLREEMGFKGLILTDAFDMGGAEGFTSAEALQAGADIVLCPSDIEKEFNSLLSYVKKGILDLNILNDRCKRILLMKMYFHLFEQVQ